MDRDRKHPAAVVIGLCAHGLAVVRALARAGVEVHALERNRQLPGAHTRLARVHAVSEVNHAGLVDDLIKVRGRFPADTLPVLFPTNDHMVRTLSEHWPRLEGLYALSWSESRDAIRSLLDKPNLERHCRERGLLYPQSWYAESEPELDGLSGDMPYPVIVKPARPLSSFKARRVGSAGALRDLGREHADAFPFVIQQWIVGDDTALGFSSFYLAAGREVARCDGRKLRALPPTLGMGTVVESCPRPDVYPVATRFFEGTGISGPAALEVKRDPAGQLWVIEPTIGRTEYCVDCCISNGVNLPFIEYAQVAGLATGGGQQRDTRVWFDTEREPLSYLQLAWHGRSPRVNGKWPRFAYLQANDLAPFAVATGRLISRTIAGLPSRLRRALGSATPAP